MLLIPEGTAFVGQGEIKEFSTEYIMEHIDEFMHPKAKEPVFLIPPHPKTRFDDEKLLVYLKDSLSLSLQQKRDIVASLPNCSQEQVDGLFEVFEKEKKKCAKLEPQKVE